MQHIANTLPSLAGNQKQIVSGQSYSPKPSVKSRLHLNELLGKVCILQKQYGKSQAELEVLVEGFSSALMGFEEQEINQAFGEYIKTKSDIPAPADILTILKEMQKYRDVVQPDLDTLRRYVSKGIPITPAQQKLLDEA